MATRYLLTVEYVDGRTGEVVADQRDIVRFERDERISVHNAIDEMYTALFWCLAYYALRRTGVLDAKVTRDVWEADVISVSVDVQKADPTQTAAPENSLSSSPTPPASRTARSAPGRRRTSQPG